MIKMVHNDINNSTRKMKLGQLKMRETIDVEIGSQITKEKIDSTIEKGKDKYLYLHPRQHHLATVYFEPFGLNLHHPPPTPRFQFQFPEKPKPTKQTPRHPQSQPFPSLT